MVKFCGVHNFTKLLKYYSQKDVFGDDQCWLLFPTAATVRFEHQSYNVNEDAGKVEPMLILSNPSSTDLTVEVMITGGSATGKYIVIISCLVTLQMLFVVHTTKCI